MVYEKSQIMTLASPARWKMACTADKLECLVMNTSPGKSALNFLWFCGDIWLKVE